MIYHVEIAGKGGITQYTYNLVTHLKKLRPESPVAILGAKDYELEKLARNFQLIRLFNRFKTNPLALLHFFTTRIKREDIVHFQLSSFPPFVLFMMLLLKSFRKPTIVVTVHNVISHETSFADKHILLTIYRLADQLIVHAHENKKELIEQFGIRKDKITVIPHGNYLFAQEIGGTPKISGAKDRFELLFFGFIRAYKGLDVLLKSLSIATEKNKHLLLHIVGKPHESFDKYAQLIESLHLQDFVDLQLEYVPIEEVQHYFQRSDAVVLPYKRISQSGVIFMAYAFGKPVIATKIGGIPEVVEDGKSGLLVPAEDEQALAQAILKLAGNKEMAEKMGAYALKLSQNKYSWQAIARKTYQLYDELIAKGR